MSLGQIEGLIGFVLWAAVIAMIYAVGYGIGMLFEKIIKKLEEKGWHK